jgi:hypothetical protein
MKLNEQKEPFVVTLGSWDVVTLHLIGDDDPGAWATIYDNLAKQADVDAKAVARVIEVTMGQSKTIKEQLDPAVQLIDAANEGLRKRSEDIGHLREGVREWWSEKRLT